MNRRDFSFEFFCSLYAFSQLASSEFLEIRVSSEGISVLCLTARVTDVRSDDLVQKANPIFFFFFFVAGFDCVSYLLSICTGFKLVTVILKTLQQQEQF